MRARVRIGERTMARNSKVRASRWPVALGLTAAVAFMTAIIVGSGTLSNLSAQSTTATQIKTVSIPVEGMSCVSCAARIKRRLKGIQGVQHVEVSLERRDAVVRFSPEKVTPDRLEAAINELGYKAG